MNRRLLLILRHWLDSLCLVSVGGTAVAIALLLFKGWSEAAAAFFGSLGVFWILALAFLAFITFACTSPRRFLSAVRAVWPLHKLLLHCGVLVKAVLGTAICRIVLEAFGTPALVRDSVLLSVVGNLGTVPMFFTCMGGRAGEKGTFYFFDRG